MTKYRKFRSKSSNRNYNICSSSNNYHGSIYDFSTGTIISSTIATIITIIISSSFLNILDTLNACSLTSTMGGKWKRRKAAEEKRGWEEMLTAVSAPSTPPLPLLLLELEMATGQYTQSANWLGTTTGQEHFLSKFDFGSVWTGL